ncbi:MAG: FtsX-like permease family protein [Candidatus Hodarchaeota archaeon]
MSRSGCPIQILRLVWHELWRRKFRAILSISVVAIGVGAFIATNGLVDTMGNSYVNVVIGQIGEADARIWATTDSLEEEWISQPSNLVFSNISSLVSKIEMTEGVRGATPRLKIPKADIRAGEHNLSVTVIGTDFQKENELNLGALSPSINSLGLNECVLMGSFGERVKQLATGQILHAELLINETLLELDLTISKVVENENRFHNNEENSILVSLETLWQIGEDIATEIDCIFENHERFYSSRDPEGSVENAAFIGRRIQEQIGYSYRVRLPIADALDHANDLLIYMRMLLNFISIVTLSIACILIYSLMTVSSEEQTYSFAVYRTVGARNSHILAIVLLQGGFLAGLGSVLGIFLGYGLLDLMVQLVLAVTPEFEGAEVAIAPITIIVGVIIGVGVGLGSAYFPARKASQANIIEALDIHRPPNPTKIAPRHPELSKQLALSGLMLALVGGVLFLALPILTAIDEPAYWSGFWLALICITLFGLILSVTGGLAPLAEKVIVRGLEFFSTGIIPLVRSMLFRHRRRNMLTSTMFAISMAFIFFLQSSVAIETASDLQQADLDIGADLVIWDQSPQKAPQLNLTTFEQMAGDASLTYSTWSLNFLLLDRVIMAGDPSFFRLYYGISVFGLPSSFSDGTFGNLVDVADGADIFSGVQENQTVIISEAFHRATSLGIDDLLRFDIVHSTLGQTTRLHFELRIAGIVEKMPGFSWQVKSQERFAGSSAIFVGNDTWNAMTRTQTTPNGTSIGEFVQRVFIRCSTQQEARDIAGEVFEEYATGISVQLLEDEKADIKQSRQQSDIVLTIILWLAIGITLFAVFANTQTAVLESRPQIGVFKAVGLKDGQIRRVFVLEAAILTLVSSLLGAIVGFSLAHYVFLNQVVSREVPFILVMPGSILLGTLGLATLLSIVSAYISSSGITRFTAAEILRMT